MLLDLKLIERRFMMIIYKNTNLLLSPAQTLVNPVNTKGVMGAGIAKEFKYYYPKMYQKYVQICRRNDFHPGELQLFKGEQGANYIRKRWVLNFPTKKHWRDPSKITYLESGLAKFAATYKARGITSVAFPPLGAGCGGLNTKQVLALMEQYLDQLDLPVYIHQFRPIRGQQGKQHDEIVKNLATDSSLK